MRIYTCPACEGDIEIYADLDIGDDVYCEDCEAGFLLVSIDPIDLQPHEPLEEFEDYFFDEEDDY